MSRIKCTLFCYSRGAHVQQLYTGFEMLAKNGLICLSQKIKPYSASNTPRTHAHLIVELLSGRNKKLILYFDNHDAHEIDKNDLQNCDIYFKRSFEQNYINEQHPDHKNNIYPLGLNYLVYPDRFSMMMLYRSLLFPNSIRRKLNDVITSIGTNNRTNFCTRLRNLYSPPLMGDITSANSHEPKVLFMVRAYDPYNDPKRPKKQIEERIYNNEFRANCVRQLRNELGPKFFGGFTHTKYTRENYNDVLLDDPQSGKKQNYLQILGQFPICIATTGLFGSIGWKFAEYVAFSKAIVSEKLNYQVPGHFQPEHNYLEFSSPEGCVEQSMRLLSNQQLRERLALNNFTYYQHHVRPDMLVINAIAIAYE